MQAGKKQSSPSKGCSGFPDFPWFKPKVDSYSELFHSLSSSLSCSCSEHGLQGYLRTSQSGNSEGRTRAENSPCIAGLSKESVGRSSFNFSWPFKKITQAHLYICSKKHRTKFFWITHNPPPRNTSVNFVVYSLQTFVFKQLGSY